MATTDSLLDFGDEPLTPQAAPLVPSGGADTVATTNGDPFDPFGGSLLDGGEVMKASDLSQSSEFVSTSISAADSDPFDPFAASPKMSTDAMATTNGTTADQQNFEAQFADLLGDFGEGSGAVQNGEVNGAVTTTVTKTTTEVTGDGDVVTKSTVTVETESDNTQASPRHSLSPAPVDSLNVAMDDPRLSASLSPPPSDFTISMTDKMDDILGEMPEQSAPRAEMEDDTDEECRSSRDGDRDLDSPSCDGVGDRESPDVMSRDFGASIHSELEFEPQPVDAHQQESTNDDEENGNDVVIDHEDISDDYYDDRAAELPQVTSEDEAESPAPDRVIDSNKMLASELTENSDHVYEDLAGPQGQGHSSDSLAEDADLADYTVVEKVPKAEYHSPDDDHHGNIVTVPISPTPEQGVHGDGGAKVDEAAAPSSTQKEHYKDPSYTYRPADKMDSSVTQEPDKSTEAFSSEERSGTQFEDTLADYQPPKRPAKKDESKDVKGPSVFITSSDEKPKVSKPLKFLGAGSDNMCKKCNKRVYEMEKIIADKSIFHKSCFRCAHCKRVLTLGNFAGIDDQTYCKPHFIELFKKKGKYDMAKQTQERPRETAQEPVREVQAEQAHTTQSAAPTRVNGSADHEEETKKDEPVRYQQMSSVRNMFESASRTEQTQSAPLPQKRASKWDKPKDSTPQEVVRRESSPVTTPTHDTEPDPAREDEMPPTTITRNLVARFRELEQGPEMSSPERRAVHKITPPRDELAASIQEAREQEAIRDDSPEPSRDDGIVKSGDPVVEDLPPPQLTRTMLAKFKSLEDVNQPPSPQQSKAATKTPTRTPQVDKTQHKPRQSSRASPDSGIVDVDHHSPNINGDREVADEDEPTKELPEEGFTRSLVAKWRVMEETSPESVSKPVSRSSSARQNTPSHQPPPATQHQTPSPAPARQEVAAQEGMDQEDGGQDPREVIREGDTNEEEFLPPPSFTKNMLAKFQNMEAEAERQATEQSQPAKKHFKWTVREAPLISSSGQVWQEKRRESSLEGELDDQHSHYSRESLTDGDQVFGGSDVPSANSYRPVNDLHTYGNSRESHMAEVYEEEEEISSPTVGEPEDELPPQALTRSMLEKFRSIEDVNRPPPSPVRAEQQQKAAYTSSAGVGMRKFSSSTSSLNQDGTFATHVYSDGEELEVNDMDERGSDDGRGQYYQEQGEDVEGGEYENDPYHDPDLVRETDSHQPEELPEEGMTRNLLAKFQSLTAAH